jgi:hypothetical protein
MFGQDLAIYRKETAVIWEKNEDYYFGVNPL